MSPSLLSLSFVKGSWFCRAAVGSAGLHHHGGLQLSVSGASPGLCTCVSLAAFTSFCCAGRLVSSFVGWGMICVFVFTIRDSLQDAVVCSRGMDVCIKAVSFVDMHS